MASAARKTSTPAGVIRPALLCVAGCGIGWGFVGGGRCLPGHRTTRRGAQETAGIRSKPAVGSTRDRRQAKTTSRARRRIRGRKDRGDPLLPAQRAVRRTHEAHVEMVLMAPPRPQSIEPRCPGKLPAHVSLDRRTHEIRFTALLSAAAASRLAWAARQVALSTFRSTTNPGALSLAARHRSVASHG